MHGENVADSPESLKRFGGEIDGTVPYATDILGFEELSLIKADSVCMACKAGSLSKWHRASLEAW
jgi:hypothetical protein